MVSIHLYCKQCRSSCPVKSKTCPKCGTPFPREGRKYRVSVKLKGQVVNRVVDNLTLARETETTIKSDLLRGEFDITQHRVKKVVTLSAVWDRYLDWAKVEKAKSWMTDDFFYRKHLQPRFGDKALDAVSSFDVERIKADMKKAVTPQGKTGYADATIRHVLVLLHHLYKKAKEWGMYAGENPVEKVRKPRPDNEVTELLSAEELERLAGVLAAWPCRASANFVRISLFTGLRKSEVQKLRWDDVDIERQTIIVKDTKNGTTTKLPLSPQAVEVFMNIERTSDFVIPGPDGDQKRTFRDPWYKIRKAAGLPEDFRFHGLRHNLASQLVSKGVDLLTVGKLLNHRDLQSTKRYAHLSDERLREAASLAGELLSPADKSTKVVPLRK